MRTFNALSIKHKLIAITLLISGSALVAVLTAMGNLQLADILHDKSKPGLVWYLMILTALSAVSYSIAALLATRLQRYISELVLELHNTMRTVSDTNDYSTRIQRRRNDEFGVLADGFNDMLAQIERRDRELVRQISQLEEQVAGRSRDLQNAETTKPAKFCGDESSELNHHPFQLHEVIDDLGERFASQAHRKTLELICDLPTTLSQGFVGDAERLRQVLFKLIGNAIKFTEKGEIVVRVETVRESVADALLRFQIKDTGIGIAPEDQERLDLMDGQIELESEPGRGSLFRFYLQLAKTPLNSPIPPPAKELHGVRVLVIDDNATSRGVLVRYLSAFGVETVAAENGQAALRLLRADAATGRPYKVALIDHHMAGLNGLALAYAITADTALPTTCMLMFSSLDGRDVIENCRNVGVHYYLAKPVKQKTLLETLLAAIRSGNVGAPQPDADKAPTEKTAECPGLDHKTLAQLRRMGTDENFFKRLATIYMSKSDSDLGALRDALAAGEAETVYQITHSFKSSSNNLGALPLASLCAELELAARRRDLGHGPRMLTAIEQEYQKVKILLRQELSNLKSSIPELSSPELSSPELSSPEPTSRKPESSAHV